MASTDTGIGGYCTSIPHTSAGTSAQEASSLGSANRCFFVNAAGDPWTIRCSCPGLKAKGCWYTFEVVTRKPSFHLAGVGNLTFIRRRVKTTDSIGAFIGVDSSWLGTMPSFKGSGVVIATALAIFVLITIATV